MLITPKAAPPERLQLRCSHSDVVLAKVLHYSIFLPSSQKKCPARLDRKGPRRAISSPLAYPDRVSGTSAARYIVYRRVKIKDWPDRKRTAHAAIAKDTPRRTHTESVSRTDGAAGDGPFGRT